MLRRKYNKWRTSYRFRKAYCTMDRHPFYDIAAKYLPSDEKGIILDIGSGEGEFANCLNLANKYENLFLLDGNSKTVENLKGRFKNAILYHAPDRLPFESATVSYVHCSHLMEYLYYQELYQFLKEIDRVLATNGIFVVSAPMLWSQFYDNLGHVRPYNPYVLLAYLCRRAKNPSREAVSDGYSVLELVYRYTTIDFDEDWGSSFLVLDFVIQLSKRLFSRLGLKKYAKNGYTLVLRKEKDKGDIGM